jgi:hypothetical protein
MQEWLSSQWFLVGGGKNGAILFIAHFGVTGMPDGIFSNQKPKLGKFGRALELKMLVYFMVILNILQAVGKFLGP